VVFCFWSLLLSSSAVEAQHCLRRRSPCVRRRQRDRGPSLLALKKPRATAGALAAIQQRCRVYRGPLLLAPEDTHASIAPKTPMRPSSAASLSSFRRRLPRYHITGPASLAEQIGPEHGCSLLFLVPLLQPDTSVPLCSTPGTLPLSTLDVGYEEAAVLSLSLHSTWARREQPVDVDAGTPLQ
jgi:hypothetical protein